LSFPPVRVEDERRLFFKHVLLTLFPDEPTNPTAAYERDNKQESHQKLSGIMIPYPGPKVLDESIPEPSKIGIWFQVWTNQ